MSIHIQQHKKWLTLPLAAITFILVSCNKDLPDPTPIVYAPVNNSTSTIGDVINSDPNYSIFKAAATRAGALTGLSDSSKIFTVFLPDDNAFIASGIPSAAVIAALPIATVGAIVNYAIIPGEQLTAADAPQTFPNVQLPTSITIALLPGTPIPLKLSTFPSKRATGFWDNNIPVVTPDLKFKNGVIHVVAGVVAPPSQVLKDALFKNPGNPNLTYFEAAIARADSGQAGLSRFDSLLNYGVTNMTVLAPDDAAFQKLIFGLAFQSYLSDRPTPYTATDTANAIATGNGAVAAGPIFLSTNNITTAQVRGIIAYHFLATDQGAGFQPNIRVFSVNFSPGPSFVTTLVNSSPVAAAHPGIMANATFTGPFVTNLTFTGLGTFPPGGAPYSGAPAKATSLDNHAVNGVYYVIDKVLLPQ